MKPVCDRCPKQKWGAESRASTGAIKGVGDGIKGFWYPMQSRYKLLQHNGSLDAKTWVQTD